MPVKRSGVSISVYFGICFTLTFIAASIFVVGLVDKTMRDETLSDAHDKAGLLLDRNLATHHYFTQELKPKLFETIAGNEPNDYFEPVWMSSTYAIRQIDKYFNLHDKHGYYYKECAVNARSSDNEADIFERAFIEELDANPELMDRSGIREVYGDGELYYETLHRGEVMGASCLRCHSTPENAPGDLVAQYGPERSFHRKAGEVISAISIRIPLAEAYASMRAAKAKLCTLLLGILGLMLFGQYLFTKKVLLRPLKVIEEKSGEISFNPERLGDEMTLPPGKELGGLVSAFNNMSVNLRKHKDTLEQRIEERTEKISRQKGFLENIIESLSHPFYVIDANDYTVKLANSAAKSYEFTDGTRCYCMTHGSDKPCEGDEHVCPIVEVKRTKKEICVEHIHYDKNGNEIVVEVHAYPIFDADGEVVEVIEYTLDVTARKEAEGQLLVERDKLKSVFTAMNDGVYIVNMDHDIEYVNPVLISEFGPFEGRKCYDYFHDRMEACSWCKNDDVFAGKSVHWEWTLAKNGKTYDLVDTPLKNPDGSISKLEIFRDITERKEAAEALKRHSLRNDTLLKLNKMRDASREDIMNFVRNEAIEITQSEFGFLGFLSDDELVMTIESWSSGVMAKCSVADKPMHFPVSKAGMWAEAVRQRKPVIINDCSGPQAAMKGLPAGHVSIKRFMCIPVFEGDQIVMVAAVANKERVYDESDISALTSMVSDAWVLFRQKQNEEAIVNLSRFPSENSSPVLRVAVDGRLLYSNNASQFLLDLWNCQTGQFVPDDWRKIVDQALEDLSDTRVETKYSDQVFSFQFVPVAKAGYVNVYGRDITERMRAEEALRLSEEKFSKTFHSSPDSVTVTSVESGRFIEVNKGFEEMAGYCRDEVIGRSTLGINLFRNPDDLAAMLNELDVKGSILDYEIQGVHKSGDIRDCLISCELIEIDSEPCLLSITRDITERKLAEEALRLSEDKFSKAFHSSPDSIAITRTEDGRILEVNKGFEEMFGYSRDEVLGETGLDLDIWLNIEDRQVMLKELEDKGRVRNLEVQAVDKTGEIHDCLFSCERIDFDGETCNVSITRDITERKHFEKALNKQRYYLEKAQKIGLIGTWELDIVKNVLIWTDETYLIFGVPVGTTLNFESFLECVHPEDREYVDTEWNKAVKGRPYDIEHRIIAGGKVKWVREKAELFFNDSGEVVRVIGVTQNITKHKLADEQLEIAKERAEAASVAKSDFLANMSHEIRTPMSVIAGFSDMLVSEDLTKQQMAYVELIRNAGKSLLVIINDILDYSKIEAGKLEIYLSEHSLKEIVDDVESMMRRLADEKGIKFGVILSDGLPEMIETDQVRINECLVNLVSNAIKFTDDGFVYVKVSMEDRDGKQFIRFDVEDSGIGIPAQDQEHIFDSFSQVEKGSTRDFGGTGLGLAITSQLAGLLDGSVSVESQEGKGSTFSLVIPAGKCIKSDSSIAKKKSGRKIIEVKKDVPVFSANVLVAEDHEGCRLIVRKMLERYGLKVTTANDGKEAIDKVENGKFDLVFMDVRMPEYNGLEATGILRQKGVDVPIIALTAHAMEGDRQLCIEAGYSDYLSKPIDRDKLLEILGCYLESEKRKV